jgi:hypothetical protein
MFLNPSSRVLLEKIVVGFEVLTAVSTKIAVSCLHRPDDGGSKDL